jgi:hypothetical protein
MQALYIAGINAARYSPRHTYMRLHSTPAPTVIVDMARNVDRLINSFVVVSGGDAPSARRVHSP